MPFLEGDGEKGAETQTLHILMKISMNANIVRTQFFRFRGHKRSPKDDLFI